MPLATGGPPQRAARLRDTRAFAQLSQFLHVFHEALGVERVDLEWLEAELGSSGDDAGDLAAQVLAGALRVSMGRRPAEGEMVAQVARAWARYGAGDLPHGFREQGFGALGAGERVRVVLETCELVLQHAERLEPAGDAAQWRVAQAGRDDLGRAYWVLCGTRLYRQTPALVADQLEGRRARRGAAIAQSLLDAAHPPLHRMREADGELWELLCADEHEWRDVAAIVGGAQTRHGRALAAALTRAASAAAHTLVRERRREPPAPRKRSSRIATREQEQLKKGTPDVASKAEAPSPPPSLAHSRDSRAQHREQARIAALDRAALDRAVLDSAVPDSAGQLGEDDWMFACLCGARGQNYDDGRAMTACERCNVWQHLGCALRAEARRTNEPIDEDDWESVRYICPTCRSSAT
ncbi:hypothetical protein LPJ61_001395 [Coemansia biformis]|uniref:Zinc finger PHD-type domain-containing protein n=1 Tax=Coemansia biformis TaxID=1286918 RepID=A0A9W7YGH8_9FUNG|nr:hypothetical protein LPJ61_001395 [Coemansia biformis]